MGYAPIDMRRRALVLIVVLIAGLPLAVTAQEQPQAPAGYPGQSNTVPDGFPTPTTAFERLTPNGPPRDPGSLDWARPGPYMGPEVVNDLRSSVQSLRNPDVAQYFQGQFRPQASTVAELAREMTAHGLRFAPATQGDQPAYSALCGNELRDGH